MYGDMILIHDINGQTQVNGRFDDWYDDSCYTVIDKQELGETIANKIIENDDRNKKNIIHEEVEKYLNDIKLEIIAYANDYLNGNV